MADTDPFIKNSIYPNAENIFSSFNSAMSSVKDDCLFVIDTNALLLPYYTSSQDVQQISSIYSGLIKEKRLFIPGQVAREFASNRPDRIKELFQQLNRKINVMQEFNNAKYPLLSNIDEYKNLIELEERFNETIKKFKDEYKPKLDRLLNKIKDWAWNDPVSELYRNLFTKGVVFDLENLDKEAIKKELDRRYLHRIPPGYKDQSKIDDGIGDLLIWFTIIDLAKKFKKSVVFVSGEEKADWVLKSEGQILYPRFELVAEFSNAVPGQSFHIIKLSELLQLMAGPPKLVSEVKQIESDFFITANNYWDWPATERSLSESDLIESIIRELASVKKLLDEFIKKHRPMLATGNFMDDLTAIHRLSLIPYDVYKRLMNFYAIYHGNPTLPPDMQWEHFYEIRLLKSNLLEHFQKFD